MMILRITDHWLHFFPVTTSPVLNRCAPGGMPGVTTPPKLCLDLRHLVYNPVSEDNIHLERGDHVLEPDIHFHLCEGEICTDPCNY